MKEYAKQCDRVLNYMLAYGTINQMQALRDIGVMRLASRISDLKKAGHIIGRRTVPVNNRYGEKCRVAEYYLIEQNGNREARVVDMGNGDKRVLICEDITEKLK